MATAPPANHQQKTYPSFVPIFIRLESSINTSIHLSDNERETGETELFQTLVSRMSHPEPPKHDRDALLASVKLKERRDILRLEKGQSSSTNQINAEEDGGGCKPAKRTRSVEVNNRNEMIRRQNVKDKIKTLRKMIPNCNKRDKSSTLDDVADYIKVLQKQIQVTMLLSILHQGNMESRFLLQTVPPRVGMEFDMGMGMLPMFNFRMIQLGSQPSTVLPVTSSGSHSITQGSSQGAPSKDRR